MSMPAPQLDDRAFQDLVDEAKRYVQMSCPEWTDNNVADPGVTLIETFALLVDQLIYRTNRVPELHYVKFLELIGAQMFPPSAAIATLRFWLSVPQPNPVLVPAGTQVSTARQGQDRPTIFSTRRDLSLVSVSSNGVRTQATGRPIEAQDRFLASGGEFECFSTVPQVGDAFYVGLSEPAPMCIVRLSIDARIVGIGVDPLRPPLIVEAWDGREWYACTVLADSTGGLNRRGNIDVQLLDVVASGLGGSQATWLRLRVVATTGDQPAYTESPRIRALSAAVIGGIVEASHDEPVTNETIGPLRGTPGEAVQLSRTPLVAGQHDLEIEVSDAEGWQTWRRVSSFSQSGPSDRHFTVDEVNGVIRFGPVVRQQDGTMHAFGRTPGRDSMLRVPSYRVGGGRQGNIEAGRLSVMRSSIPFVSKVENPLAAIGGVDAETLDEVKERAPMLVRSRDRAITASDFEHLVKVAAPSISRVKCVDAGSLGAPGTTLVLIVPETPLADLNFQSLQPQPEVLDVIRRYLDERRLIGSTVRIEPPRYLGVSVMARLDLEQGASRERVVPMARAAVRDFLHPSFGGYDGQGWPFGRSLLVGEVRAVLQRVTGVASVNLLRLVPVTAATGVRGEPQESIDIGPLELLFCVGNDIEASR